MDLLDFTLSDYDCFHINKQGDGALILFRSAENAASFSLSIQEKWKAKVLEISDVLELEQDISLPFRLIMHFGALHPQDPEYKSDRQFASSQIDAVSRLKSIKKECRIATDIFVHSVGERSFEWKKLKDNLKHEDCIVPDGYRLYELIGRMAEKFNPMQSESQVLVSERNKL